MYDKMERVQISVPRGLLILAEQYIELGLFESISAFGRAAFLH